MSEPQRILVADDEPVVRAAYRTFFSQQEEFVVCGEARTGAEAVEGYAALLPDIVLMDLEMPVVSGIDATRRICEDWPAACVVAMPPSGPSSTSWPHSAPAPLDTCSRTSAGAVCWSA